MFRALIVGCTLLSVCYALPVVEETSSHPTITSLDKPAYLGRWYNVFVNNVRFKGSCITANYAAVDSNSDAISLINRGKYTSFGNGTSSRTDGFAVQSPNASQPGYFNVLQGPGPDGPPPSKPQPYSTANYIIMELGPIVDGLYDYSLITGGKGELFVIARDMDRFADKYQRVVLEKVARWGFNNVVATPQASCSTTTRKLVTFDGAKGTTFPLRFQGDPVMGGASTGTFTLDTKSKVAILNGTVAIIPYLKAPGTIQGYTQGQIADVSEFNALQMRVKSTVPYANFKMAFSAPGVPHKRAYGTGSFKSDVTIQGSEWQTVSVPFSSFSWDWSTYTGECNTTDPDGMVHQCCDKDHPEVCPTAKFLSTIDGLHIWAEGAVGNVHLEIGWFGAATI